MQRVIKRASSNDLIGMLKLLYTSTKKWIVVKKSCHILRTTKLCKIQLKQFYFNLFVY